MPPEHPTHFPRTSSCTQLQQHQQQQRIVVAFNVSKGETVDPNDPSLRRCCRLLQQLGCTCVVNRSLLNLERLHRHGVSLLILGNPVKPFTADELLSLKLFLQASHTDTVPGPSVANVPDAVVATGLQTAATVVTAPPPSTSDEPVPLGDPSVHATKARDSTGRTAGNAGCSSHAKASTASVRQVRSILVLGGSNSSSSNVNFLLEEMGLSLAADSVVSAVPPTPQQQQRGVYHPREVLLQQDQLVGEKIQQEMQRQQQQQQSGSSNGSDCTGGVFVYPYGSTVYVQAPAVPLLCSSNYCSPSQRPLIGAAAAAGGGVLIAAGSSKLLQDPYLNLYSNTELVRLLLQLLLGRVSLDQLQPTTGEVTAAISKYTRQIDTEVLSLLPQPCLEAPPDVPREFRLLHQQQSFALQPRLLLRLQQLLQQINTNSIGTPLELIKPKLLQPFPPLRPALHPPIAPSFPVPSLPLVDLDSLMMSPQQRLLAAAADAAATFGANAQASAAAESLRTTAGDPIVPQPEAAATTSAAQSQRENSLVNFILTAAKVTCLFPSHGEQQQNHFHPQQQKEQRQQNYSKGQQYEAMGREARARAALVRLLVHTLERRCNKSQQQTDDPAETV
ncbi:Intraflagellar transport protein 52-like, related [Eimeria praecox]|uniref:Intraflagellar transport protein 52-like, related n=1 Tax=Eimeria praecox TaxID=51316 RepID=U6H2Y5_9EIME|nr:Intraflagellar transport protein 52-like, related [Eimeria praecox]